MADGEVRESQSASGPTPSPGEVLRKVAWMLRDGHMTVHELVDVARRYEADERLKESPAERIANDWTAAELGHPRGQNPNFDPAIFTETMEKWLKTAPALDAALAEDVLGPEPTTQEIADIDTWFGTRSPKPGEVEAQFAIVDMCKGIAQRWIGMLPRSRERSAAIMRLREAMLMAIESVSCNPKGD